MKSVGTRAAVVTVASCMLLSGCEAALDEDRFARRAEQAFSEVHTGWTIIHRQEATTTFVRGDQRDVLAIDALYVRYLKSGSSPSSFFAKWKREERARAAARRRTLAEAVDDVIPILKEGNWIRVQDLSAIGPPRVRDGLRPWRKAVAADVYVVLGLPEGKVGYRFVTIDEMRASLRDEQSWIAQAVANLARRVRDVDGEAFYASADDLSALDVANVEGVSGLLLDPKFRRRMLARFGRPELGAAIPVRNSLIVFDPDDVRNLKPIRSRTYQRYDTENHPGFRGLLRFNEEAVSVLEPARPARKQKGS